MSEFWKNLRVSFFAGLLVVVPVAASIGILLWLFNTVTNWLVPAVLREPNGSVPFTWRLIALGLFVTLVSTVGWATRLVMGRRLVALTESAVQRVPLLNKIYGFMKEVSQTMFSGRKTMFQRVVLIEFPRPGTYAIGFVTSETEGEVQALTKETVVNVFVPTTPNPTSGFLVMVPRDQIHALQMSVAEGMKMVVSGGAVVPPYTSRTQQPAATSAL